MASDPFWFDLPPAGLDIARLRPASLPRGKRFETPADARRESLRSEKELQKAGASALAEYLADCRGGHYDCVKTYCPACARRFRRWYTGELLRLYPPETKANIVTILLEKSETLSNLEPRAWHRTIRHRLAAVGLGDEMVVGGIEVAWRAREKLWVLHAHLAISNCTSKQYKKLNTDLDDDDVSRPVLGQELQDRAEQLSYTLKFVTYHRPHPQRGKSKPKALSLNRKQHVELVRWMGQYKFTYFLFLFGCRRVGNELVRR